MCHGYLHIHEGRGGSRIILGIHVDDQVITGSNSMVVKTFKGDMGKKFKVKDLGPLTNILGVEVKRDRQRKLLTLGQLGFLKGVLERYGMHECNPTKLPLAPGTQFTKFATPRNPTTYSMTVSHSSNLRTNLQSHQRC